MSINDYIKKISNIPINTMAVSDVERRYRISCPEILQKIISNSRETVFLGNEVRILSLSEMLNAPRNLHVDFIGLGMIPFADCYDNDFAVFCWNQKWAHFNIVDNCKFDETENIQDLFK